MDTIGVLTLLTDNQIEFFERLLNITLRLMAEGKSKQQIQSILIDTAKLLGNDENVGRDTALFGEVRRDDHDQDFQTRTRRAA